MMSWWDFGESRGYSGEELATHQISCPFCPEKGNFKVAHHLEKKNSAGKKLNYDTLQCENCGNLTMAFWSSAQHRQFHDYQTVPWSLTTHSYPKHWPEDFGRNWLQAQRSVEGKNWDAAALMARTAIRRRRANDRAPGWARRRRTAWLLRHEAECKREEFHRSYFKLYFKQNEAKIINDFKG